MKTVWVYSRFSRDGGGNVMGVSKTQEGARELVKEEFERIDLGSIDDSIIDSTLWSRNGLDYHIIREFEVQ